MSKLCSGLFGLFVIQSLSVPIVSHSIFLKLNVRDFFSGIGAGMCAIIHRQPEI